PSARTSAAPPALEGLVGFRSSKGRYYQEYRHSAQDLERALLAVNSVSWALAHATGDARSLVDSTLPVVTQLLGASTVLLVSEHPALGRRQVRVRAASPSAPEPAGALTSEPTTEQLVEHAAGLVRDSWPNGSLSALPELACTLLVAPLPHPCGVDGYVVAAVPLHTRADATDLALLGTLANQLAGAIESSWRLEESERLREAADDARRRSGDQAVSLARRNLQLKQARHELAAAREAQVLAEERQRIARDLHDSVAQHVLSMGMAVEVCRVSSTQPELAEQLGEVKELARATVDRIRQAIFSLSGGDELQHGLLTALHRLADQRRGNGLAVAVRVLGAPVPLPVEVERALFMVAKESLFNTVIHAEATRASVVLEHAPAEVRMRVTDNGQGRAADLRRHLQQTRMGRPDGCHRGLVNMHDRVRLVGGDLSLQDAPRSGVLLEVVVPLAPARCEPPTDCPSVRGAQP
ncbi:MAG: sensor histidine kinase, partial [Actinomycetota bacterium]|nr:sensor histidine kinase [Actinomycetota bacterium]